MYVCISKIERRNIIILYTGIKFKRCITDA